MSPCGMSIPEARVVNSTLKPVIIFTSSCTFSVLGIGTLRVLIIYFGTISQLTDMECEQLKNNHIAVTPYHRLLSRCHWHYLRGQSSTVGGNRILCQKLVNRYMVPFIFCVIALSQLSLAAQDENAFCS